MFGTHVWEYRTHTTIPRNNAIQSLLKICISSPSPFPPFPPPLPSFPLLSLPPPLFSFLQLLALSPSYPSSLIFPSPLFFVLPLSPSFFFVYPIFFPFPPLCLLSFRVIFSTFPPFPPLSLDFSLSSPYLHYPPPFSPLSPLSPASLLTLPLFPAPHLSYRRLSFLSPLFFLLFPSPFPSCFHGIPINSHAMAERFQPLF